MRDEEGEGHHGQDRNLIKKNCNGKLGNVGKNEKAKTNALATFYTQFVSWG